MKKTESVTIEKKTIIGKNAKVTSINGRNEKTTSISRNEKTTSISKNEKTISISKNAKAMSIDGKKMQSANKVKQTTAGINITNEKSHKRNDLNMKIHNDCIDSDEETLKKIAKIDRELDKRRSDKLVGYNNGAIVHSKQMEFHKSANRVRFVFGGNRCGKTECGAVETVWTLTGEHPYRQNRNNVNGWVVSVSTKVQREVAQAKILYYLPKRAIADIVMLSGKKNSPMFGVIDYILVKNILGGLSKISFKNYEQDRDKFQGASLDFVWFDEEPPEDIFNECRMRILDKVGDIWCTMTPLKGLTFIYNEIYLNSRNNPEIWHITMNWNDNPFLPKNEVEQMTMALSEMELQSRKFGHFYTATGLVYSEFEENIHVIEPFAIPSEWQDNISIDPGLSNPLSCHFYCVDYDGNIYVVGEHYEAMKDIDYHAEKIFELADKLNWKRDNYGRLNALIDSAANQKTLSGSRSVSELFYDRRIMVNTKVNKDLFSGISKIKSLLKPPAKLFIFKNCVNLIREMKSYWWGNNDSPIKKDDHALDELRYYVNNNPNAPKISKMQNVIQKDKEMLYLKLKRKGQ